MKTSASEPGISILHYDNQSWYHDFGLFEKLTLTRSISISYLLCYRRKATLQLATLVQNGSSIEAVPPNNVGS